MAVRFVSVVAVVCLVGCSGGAEGTGAEIPMGAAQDAAAAGDAGGVEPEAGSNDRDGGVPVDPTDAAVMPDALATQPAGNHLSVDADAGVPWTEGDPAALYPYAAAYSYQVGNNVVLEIEFSSTPATDALGRRVVVSCLNPYTCSQAFIRNARACEKYVVSAPIEPLLQPIKVESTGTAATVSGHLSGLDFYPTGYLAVDLLKLPIQAATRSCPP